MSPILPLFLCPTTAPRHKKSAARLIEGGQRYLHKIITNLELREILRIRHKIVQDGTGIKIT